MHGSAVGGTEPRCGLGFRLQHIISGREELQIELEDRDCKDVIHLGIVLATDLEGRPTLCNSAEFEDGASRHAR